MKLTALITLLCVAFSFSAFAHDMPAPKISKDFESLKALVGTWEGTSKMEGKEQPTTVTYELTSGGTAMAEKLNPGTPHEMLSVYANRGNQDSMTHYCVNGNQPEMKI